jgi:N-acetyl-anhydromuramyl-L-alanine amidase AmpD
MRILGLASLLTLAACAAEPSTNVVDLSGSRNDALRAAAKAHGLTPDWLAAIGYVRGRFESAETTSDAPADAEDPADVLADDTSLDADAAGDPTVTDDAPQGDDAAMPESWGVMFLTDEQVAAAAQLTGHDADAIRTDIAANIDAAAALIDAQRPTRDDAGLRTATAAFLGFDAAADADDAQLALGDLDDVIRDGFDLTTDDGERLELVGTNPSEPIARVAPGHTPPYTWIPSPNHSSRDGYAIKYIVVHDIEGTQAGAVAVFKNPANQTSAHYIIRARDGHIVKMVLESQNAWHVGHGWFNRHSIGIEHEGFAAKKNGGGYYTDKQYATSASLACAIAHRYNIPINRAHIFGHFNVPSNLASHTLCSDARGIAGHCGGVSHHSDPGRYWNWTKYMKLIRTCVAAI